MVMLAETSPTLDCAQCILTPKKAEVSRHHSGLQSKYIVNLIEDLAQERLFISHFRKPCHQHM